MKWGGGGGWRGNCSVFEIQGGGGKSFYSGTDEFSHNDNFRKKKNIQTKVVRIIAKKA